MGEKTILSEEEIGKINNKYDFGVKDEFMTKRYINIEKNLPWKNVKNNTKQNKFKKKDDKIIIRTDPYKFVDIPKNIKQIILNLCDKHQLTIQTLAVKCNLKFHIIENYINNNYILDNYYLHIILKGLNFDLLEYIKEQNEIKNKNIEDTSINMETY